MELSPSNESQNISLNKFESMLKTNNVFFFDSNEFENIIHHYLEIGKIALAKKAINLGLDQHPSSVNLRLFKVEILIFLVPPKFATYAATDSGSGCRRPHPRRVSAYPVASPRPASRSSAWTTTRPL